MCQDNDWDDKVLTVIAVLKMKTYLSDGRLVSNMK